MGSRTVVAAGSSFEPQIVVVLPTDAIFATPVVQALADGELAELDQPAIAFNTADRIRSQSTLGSEPLSNSIVTTGVLRSRPT